MPERRGVSTKQRGRNQLHLQRPRPSLLEHGCPREAMTAVDVNENSHFGAEAEGLTQKEFNDRMNDPDKYQLEDPSSNRSRKYECVNC
jgi:hypothetical protein